MDIDVNSTSAVESAMQIHFEVDGKKVAEFVRSDTLERRDFSQAERDSMDSEDFAGPHESFPIKSQEDVYNAAKLIGHADNPAAVKSRIKSIAKRKGLKLPDSWENESEDTKERAMNSDEEEKSDQGDDSDADKPVDVSEDGSHGKFSGSHSHVHDAFQRADGSKHSHKHNHDNDNDHNHHASSDDTKERAVINQNEKHLIYAPFMRIDSAKREVIGQATVEMPDSYGTIFGYYPKAWETWRGNIREQHDPKKAVGKRIQHFAHDDTKSVDLHVRVSRGANDTWMKVEDDVLSGFSLSIVPDPEFGNDVRKWPKKEYEGKEYPYLPRYSIAEVSLVDNPSCPGCNFEIVRADGFATDIIEDEEEVKPEVKTIERAGAKISSDSRNKIHAAIKSLQDTCGCPECQYEGSPADEKADAAASEEMERKIASIIERTLQPVFMRLNKLAGNLSRNSDTSQNSTFDRALEGITSKIDALVTNTSFDELRAELSAVKDRVVQIAEQPMPGGPVLNASAVEKRLPTEPSQYQQVEPDYGAVYTAISNLSKSGRLDTPDKQIEAMTAGLKAQRYGR